MILLAAEDIAAMVAMARRDDFNDWMPNVDWPTRASNNIQVVAMRSNYNWPIRHVYMRDCSSSVQSEILIRFRPVARAMRLIELSLEASEIVLTSE